MRLMRLRKSKAWTVVRWANADVTDDDLEPIFASDLAAEVTGALQDTKRATLVGQTSFGKGTVQQWQELSGEGGAFKLTIARWLTPDKRWIHKVGLKPDVVVEIPDATAQPPHWTAHRQPPPSAPAKGRTPLDDLIEQIVGRRLEGAMQWEQRAVDRTGEPLLEVENLQSDGVNGATFSMYPGEIVGLVGLMGSGRTEIAETLFGVRRKTGGSVKLGGRAVTFDSPEQAIAGGLALVPEDRRVQGLVLDASVGTNLLMPQLSRFVQGGVVQDTAARDYADTLVAQLRIKTDNIDKKTRLLSGGNQQKIVVAKWLGNDPRLLILDEPTAGVDIGSKSEIIALIRELASQGKAVLVISSELPELLALSDRLLVVEGGRIKQDLGRSGQETEEDLHRALQRGQMGGEAHAAAAG